MVQAVVDRFLIDGSQNIAVTKSKIQEARAADGNESFTSSDIPVDWLRFRRSGGASSTFGYSGEAFGNGMLWGGYDCCSFADGTAY